MSDMQDLRPPNWLVDYSPWAKLVLEINLSWTTVTFICFHIVWGSFCTTISVSNNFHKGLLQRLSKPKIFTTCLLTDLQNFVKLFYHKIDFPCSDSMQISGYGFLFKVVYQQRREGLPYLLVISSYLCIAGLGWAFCCCFALHESLPYLNHMHE